MNPACYYNTTANFACTYIFSCEIAKMKRWEIREKEKKKVVKAEGCS